MSYAAIDSYALNAPQAKSEADMKELVTYLTKPYHNDLEKARSIFAWIVYNIDYDAYKAKLIEDPRFQSRLEKISRQHILATRVGVCDDIANLYQEMSSMAGLNVQTVDGWVIPNQTRRRKTNVEHRWVALKIADSWEFLDPTWAIGETAKNSLSDVTTNNRYESEIKKRVRDKKTYEPRKVRHVHNTWFLTNKREFARTHLPELEQWQLQETKMTKDEFLGQKSNKRKKR